MAHPPTPTAKLAPSAALLVGDKFGSLELPGSALHVSQLADDANGAADQEAAAAESEGCQVPDGCHVDGVVLGVQLSAGGAVAEGVHGAAHVDCGLE